MTGPFILAWLTCAPINPGPCMRHWQTEPTMAQCEHDLATLPRDDMTDLPPLVAMCGRGR